MARQQLVADVHPDELCPLNKQYDLMDANKKIDLEHVQCPPESKILTNIIKNHLLRFSIAASSFVPWIYMAQTIFHLPQATDNNHDSFVPPPSFYDMIPFYKNHFGFTLELKTPSSFKTTGLLQPEIQRQNCNENSRLDDLRRDEANGALLDVYRAPLLTVDKADELILQDTLQVSLAEHKSRQEQEARENVALVEKHLASEEIVKMMVEGQEHVVDDSSIPRNDEHNIPDTRLEPRSDKESPKVGITDVIVHVNVYDEKEDEDLITNEVYELKRRKKGKNVEESRITPFPTPIRSPRIHIDLELQGHYGYFFEHLSAKFMPRKSLVTLADHLHEATADSLPTMVDKYIKEKVEKQVPEQVPQTTCKTPVIRPRDQDNPRDDAHPKGEKSVKWQKTSEYETYVSRESSSGQDNKQEKGPLTSGNQEQADDYDF
nr:hypothetical protein [Tanacetum cinerariifolium]